MDLVFTDVSMLDVPPDVPIDAGRNVRVFVAGSTPLPRERSLRARFDDHRVVGVRIDAFGTGFTGYLAARPPEGARLVVEFDGEEIDTGLVYQEEEPPPVA